MNNPNYLVQVRCLTYNHAAYITDTMNGFCMQQTEFPFICTIFDDKSTDGEQEVIRNYLDENFIMNGNTIQMIKETDDYVLIYTRHKTNINCYFAVYFLKYNHYQLNKSRVPYLLPEWNDIKYIAICEGDDYWTDSCKLQLQVDFLNCNDDVSMVFSRCHVLYRDRYIDDEYPNFKGINDCYFNSEQLYTKWIVPTATIVYRSKLFRRYTDKRIYAGDRVLHLRMAEQGKVFGMSDYTAVYRINEDGLTISRRTDSLKMWENYVGFIQFLRENFKSVPQKCYSRELLNVYTNIFSIKYNEGIYDYNTLKQIFFISPVKAVELGLGKIIIKVFQLNKHGIIRSSYRKLRYKS